MQYCSKCVYLTLTRAFILLYLTDVFKSVLVGRNVIAHLCCSVYLCLICQAGDDGTLNESQAAEPEGDHQSSHREDDDEEEEDKEEEEEEEETGLF